MVTSNYPSYLLVGVTTWNHPQSSVKGGISGIHRGLRDGGVGGDRSRGYAGSSRHLRCWRRRSCVLREAQEQDTVRRRQPEGAWSMPILTSCWQAWSMPVRRSVHYSRIVGGGDLRPLFPKSTGRGGYMDPNWSWFYALLREQITSWLVWNMIFSLSTRSTGLPLSAYFAASSCQEFCACEHDRIAFGNVRPTEPPPLPLDSTRQTRPVPSP